MELSHRLGKRTSAVLGLFGHSPIEVHSIVKRACDIRSRYIHG